MKTISTKQGWPWPDMGMESLEPCFGILISGIVNNQVVFVKYFASPPKKAIWVIFFVLHFIDWSVVSIGHGRLLMWPRGSSPLFWKQHLGHTHITEGSGSFLSWSRSLMWART